ncbi:efflux RND transporter periplasmic adaptor subunit [Bacteroides sp. 224]|uniref:efflux RND transporter periplasmic adaptor subunit n=1 Tax=Bacteroides sp. 224 TaxID=2302936 RepID=UPI0013D51DCE|nr:efflux RND transporter periplasmic adaptor subunit [Bacteroides sp. 224]NDV65633.1 efflux RND transporter periplasmic adaptor subunit [Bacteroides sp. 224]
MKKLIFVGVLGLFLLGSCQSRSKADSHNHEGHNHDHSAHAQQTTSHNHEGCDHDHDHDQEHNHDHDHDHNHGHSHEEGNSDEIVLSKEKAEAAGVKSAVIKPGTFNQVIKTSGQVLAAQGDEATAVATVAGVVSFRNRLLEGMSVNKGSSLLTVSAKNMVDGDPIQKARVTFEKAQKEFERMQALVKNKIVSEKDFNQAELEYQNARISYEAVAKNHSTGGQMIISPITGFVKNILVKEGDYVEVGQPVVSITQNRKLFLRAEVSEKYYSHLHTISSANFKTPYNNAVYQLNDLGGRLLSFGKAAGDNSYYVPVTFEFDNKGDILPGSFVEIYLLSSPINNVISLPHSALTEEQGSFFVYQQLDDECYKKQEVTLGADNGESIQILTGISAGERIVTHGAYQVKLASASNVLPAHSHEH